MLGVHKVKLCTNLKKKGGNKIYRQHRYFVTITNTRFFWTNKNTYTG